MLVNKVLPGLFNGVSQQSPTLRLDTQCELMENMLPSVAEGSSKRPPTEHLAVLTSNASETSYAHTINRDTDERYIVILTGNASEPVEVYTMTGIKCTVNSDATSRAYLTAADPLSTFRATTVADYTLITNRSKICLMDPTLSSVDTPTAIINVAKGVANQDYNVYLNGLMVATYTTGDTTQYETYKTSRIAQELYNDLAPLGSSQLIIDFAASAPVYGNSISITLEGVLVGTVAYFFDAQDDGGGGTIWVYNPTRTAQNVYDFLIANVNTVSWYIIRANARIYIRKVGATTFPYSITGGNPALTAPTTTSQWLLDYVMGQSIIRITRLDNSDFQFSVSDTYGQTALIGIKGQAQKFSDLPATCFNGTRVEITGDPANGFDNYHLQYQTEDGRAIGVWKEVSKQGIRDQMDKNTMPHQLVRTGVNTFTLSAITWLDRQVGDTASCPSPSFIGGTISDIFFYRNRLGFLSGENVILSKAGEFFDFWPTTATAVLDDDPIDISCPTNEVTQLLHAVPFPQSLFLVGAQQQFSLHSGNLNLSPKTVAVDITTHFEVSALCRPVVSGSNVYLPVPKGDYTSLREYFITSETFTMDAADVTAHVPTYIPKNISTLAASSTFDLLIALTQDTPDTLYVYKYYWVGDQKAQSAWGQWKVDGQIINCSILSNYLFLVVKRGSLVTLERLRLEQAKTGALPYRVHLDRLVSLTGTYNAETGKTVWTLPYADASSGFSVIRGDTGFKVASTKVNNTIEATGDCSSAPCWIGRNYAKRYRFSEWKVKAEGANVGILQGRLQVRTLTVNCQDTGYYRVEVAPRNRDTNTAVMTSTGATLGISKIGDLGLYSGEQRFTIMTNPAGCTIDIINDSHLPSCLTMASYEGFFTVRSRSMQ